MKGILVLLGLVFLGAITLVKRHQAKKRLAQVDAGERCLACDGVQMQREGPLARCLQCGHTYNAAQMAWVDAGSEAQELAQADDSNAIDP